MRINEYNSLDDFIYEYDSGRQASIDATHGQKFMGLEIKYAEDYYRICREPLTEAERPVLADGRLGLYNVTIMHCDKLGYPIADSFESIGWYSDIFDLLDNCYINGVAFMDVIMDDRTEILSKD